jgi:hypothetical protein
MQSCPSFEATVRWQQGHPAPRSRSLLAPPASDHLPVSTLCVGARVGSAQALWRGRPRAAQGAVNNRGLAATAARRPPPPPPTHPGPPPPKAAPNTTASTRLPLQLAAHVHRALSTRPAQPGGGAAPMGALLADLSQHLSMAGFQASACGPQRRRLGPPSRTHGDLPGMRSPWGAVRVGGALAGGRVLGRARAAKVCDESPGATAAGAAPGRALAGRTRRRPPGTHQPPRRP